MIKEIQSNKELKEVVSNIADDAIVVIPCWNGYSDTYTVADHIHICKYEDIENDFFGTDGKMDRRLFCRDLSNKDVIYIGSMFSRKISNPKIDLDSDPNTPIALINGENGDHDMFWKHNGFEKITKMSGGEYWKKEFDNVVLMYHPHDETIEVIKGDDYHFHGKCVGVYDFFDILQACKIKHTWRIG